jgi:hypothetical protein
LCRGEKEELTVVTTVAGEEMEYQGCWTINFHVTGEVMVAEEAEVTAAEKKKMIMAGKE